MSTRNTIIIALLLALAVLAAGLILQPQFPEQMATHWNAQGEADDYGSHFIGIWLLPIVMVGLTLLLAVIPAIDPLGENVGKFRKEYNGFVLVFAVFLGYLQVLTLVWNLGVQFDLNRYLVPAFGAFIFYAGVLIGKARRNFFIGVRTPWTLMDEQVWDETHRLGALLFKISGLVALLGILLPSLGILLLLAPVLISTIVVVVYSYLRYRRYHPDKVK